jgi:hypothetical protein
VHPDVLHVPAELPFPFNFIEVEVVGPVCDQRHLNGSRYVVAISDCHTRYVQATLFQVPAIPQVATVLSQEVLRRYDLLTALGRTEQEWVSHTVEYKLREILEQGVRAQLHRSDLPRTTAASSHRHPPTSQPRKAHGINETASAVRARRNSEAEVRVVTATDVGDRDTFNPIAPNAGHAGRLVTGVVIAKGAEEEEHL